MEPVTATIATAAALINQLSAFFTALIGFIPVVIGFASIIATLIPKPEGDSKLAKFHKYLNLLAFNVKNAANKD